MTPLVDLLVANLNTADLIISGIIDPLRDHWDHELTLIVADDGSRQDDLDTLVPAMLNGSRLICHQTRRGVARTFNTLLDASTAPVRFLVNSDIQFHDFSEIEALLEAFHRLHGEVILGTAEGPRFLDAQALPYTLIPEKGGTPPWIQNYVAGCAMMLSGSGPISRQRFETSFSKCYYEDSDFSYRGRALGCETYFLPTTIRHLQNQAMIRLEMETIGRPNHYSVHEAMRVNQARFLKRWKKFLLPRYVHYADAEAAHLATSKRLREEPWPCKPL